jgi:exosome complex exonuclease RRP6
MIQLTEATQVLHGADSDVLWLQRDFGIYLVNLFDTYHATKVLGELLRACGLSSVTTLKAADRLQTFPLIRWHRSCRSTASSPQTNDIRLPTGAYGEPGYIPLVNVADSEWIYRPLPEEMLHYARADTHFLLFVYDHLRTTLFSRSTPPQHTSPTALIEEVLYRSSQTALRTYEAENYDYVSGYGVNGWRALAKRWNKGAEWRIDLSPGARGPGSGLDFEVFRALHDWRDRVARAEDESPVYVMPHPTLYKLATERPTDAGAVIVCASPVPPLVHVRAGELAKVIADAVNEYDGVGRRETGERRPGGSKGKTQREEEVVGAADMDWEPAVQPAVSLWDGQSRSPSLHSAFSLRRLIIVNLKAELLRRSLRARRRSLERVRKGEGWRR